MALAKDLSSFRPLPQIFTGLHFSKLLEQINVEMVPVINVAPRSLIINECHVCASNHSHGPRTLNPCRSPALSSSSKSKKPLTCPLCAELTQKWPKLLGSVWSWSKSGQDLILGFSLLRDRKGGGLLRGLALGVGNFTMFEVQDWAQRFGFQSVLRLLCRGRGVGIMSTPNKLYQLSSQTATA